MSACAQVDVSDCLSCIMALLFRRHLTSSVRSRFAVLSAAGTILVLLVVLELDGHSNAFFQGFPASSSDVLVRKVKSKDKSADPGGATPSLYSLLPCGWTTSTFSAPTRTTAYLTCSQSSFLQRSQFYSSIAFDQVRSDVTPSVTSLEDTQCLKRVIRNHCTHPSLRVPRVVHYIVFGASDMSLEMFISILSVKRFIRPCLILIHGDVVPTGQYWRAILHLVNNIVHVRHKKPMVIFGRVISHLAHSSDVARLRILSELGGIYVDNDQFVLRPLDDLYNESMVISIEVKDFNCGNGFLLAEPKAPFLHRWLSNYTDFDGSHWAVHSTVRPYRLSRDFPRLVRVIDSFYIPSYWKVRAFFNRTLTPSHDWGKQHGFHLYHNRVRDLFMKKRIDFQDNVVGDVVRYILYGDMKKCMQRA